MSLMQRREEGPSWRELLEEGERMLREAGIEEADLDAWYLLSAAFGIDRVHYYLDRNVPVRQERLDAGLAGYRSCLLKRASRIPLQQILGCQEFMGMNFSVDENVLIPRQDTEKLVETVLSDFADRETRVLDMCTGSGCIAVSLAVLGGYRDVTAADLSRKALRIAAKNAKRLFLIQKGTVRSRSLTVSEEPRKLELTSLLAADAKNPAAGSEERKFTLIESDLFSAFDPQERFDLVVSNPPYIPTQVIEGLEPEVRDHEPRMALDGSSDGLHFYRALALSCSRFLNRGGSVVFEIGYDQGEAVSRILSLAGYEEIEVIKDEPGLDRVVKARWNRTVQGGTHV